MKVIKVIARYVIFLFRGFFFHYNVMIFYYSINSPLSQFSPNLQQKRSVFSVCRRRSVSSKRAPKSSVNSVRSVRDKTPHCESQAFFFSQIYTEEQNTQPTEASPPAPLRMERGVLTEIPLYVLRMFSSPSPPNTRLIGVTSHTTPLSIRRGVGGEAGFSTDSPNTQQWWRGKC